jgi:AcrR family transcriptional regulator
VLTSIAVNPVSTDRKTAEERREAILAEALHEFAAKGLAGASTDTIARRAGISQPYLFRLFGTKKELFVASADRCLRETREAFRRAAEGKRGEEALEAMGHAYMEMITGDPARLRAQLQSYAACDDPEICGVVRRGYGDLVEFVERASGLPADRVMRFFAKGMLINVIASMHLLDADEPWARRLLDACLEAPE